MNTKLIPLIITLVVGIILAGSLLIPVINDAKTTIGDATIINNENITPTADYTQNDLIMTVTPADDAEGYAVYINDVGYAKPSTTKVGLISDRLFVNISSTSGRSAEIRYWDETNLTEVSTNVTADLTITYTHANHELVYESGTTTFTYEDVLFIFVWDENGQYGEVTNNTAYPNKVFRMESINDNSWGVFDYAANFTLGEETHRGMITMSKYGLNSYFEGSPEWTVSFEYGTPTLKEGTTDLYTGLQPYFRVTDADGNTQTYEPYRAFILNEAKGHESAGAAYSLLGAIPIMVIIGLVLAATAALVTKRND